MEHNSEKPVISEERRHDSSRNFVMADPAWTTALVWLGSSAVSGIVGNVAYDKLKQLLLKFRSSGRTARIEEADAMLLAQLAILIQCRSLSLPKPDLNALSADMSHDRDGSWHVVLAGDELVANVRIPAGDLNDTRVSVTILHHKVIEFMRHMHDL